MNYSKILKWDCNNADGVSVTLFVTGCNHACPGCFNEELWKHTAGLPFTDDVKNELLEALKNPYVDSLSLLGGDPLSHKNYQTILSLCKEVSFKFPTKKIWCWTGWTKLELEHHGMTEIFDYIDVLVDGRFVQELKDEDLDYRGSSNQNIIYLTNQ